MCDDFLYHHNVLTHHFLFYHYPKKNSPVFFRLTADPLFCYSASVSQERE
ncbi:MAG: hypothetical protein ACTFAK_01030 [Candidatus Electronema sp. VV]